MLTGKEQDLKGEMGECLGLGAKVLPLPSSPCTLPWTICLSGQGAGLEKMETPSSSVQFFLWEQP